MENIDYKELTELFDERYVRKNDCGERHKETDEKINEMAISLTKNTEQLNSVIKIGSAILIAVIGVLATQIGSLIFK